MYKMDTRSRQIWHTNIKDYTLKTFIKSPHYCAIIYRGIKNRAAMKGDGQSITISTQRCSKVLKSNWLNLCQISRGHTYSWGFFYCRKNNPVHPHWMCKYQNVYLALVTPPDLFNIAVACVNATNSSWIYQMLQTLQSCGDVTLIKDTSAEAV